jgi:hypothetical protein
MQAQDRATGFDRFQSKDTQETRGCKLPLSHELGFLTMCKALAAVLAASLVGVTFGVLPAAAAKKEKPRTRSDASPSLDGRVLGYPRTCGYDYFLYSSTGSPMGPYCH